MSSKPASASSASTQPKPTLVASTLTPAAKSYRVVDTLAGLKIGGRSRVELSKVRQLYVEACKRRGCNAVGGDAFLDDVVAWCKAQNVELQGCDGRVFIVGVKLVA